jgi:uncharacterized protein with NRDE domain
MCLIFIGLKKHPAFKLIIAANRDEFYNRRTAAASYWTDHPEILGGRDLEAGGTWLAINKKGRISMITNFRDPMNINPNAPSRGQLVSDFLITEDNAERYLQRISSKAKNYNGFNLIAGTVEDLFYLSNYREGITKMSEGLFGLSNHLLDTPWPKIKRGKENLLALLKETDVSSNMLFEILNDDLVATDDVLPDTGVGLDRERILSSMFIKSPGYGTRCSTVILVDYHNHVTFTERVYNVPEMTYTINKFEFQIG